MKTLFRVLLWLIALVLIVNFVVLRLYGNTLQSTNLFIVRGTVFYPVAYLNLILGILLIIFLIWELVDRSRNKK